MKARTRVWLGAATVVAVSVLALPVGLHAPTPQPAQSAVRVDQLQHMPLAFTENKGQWDDRVLFRANAGGATMWFTREGICYQFTRRVPKVSETGVKGVGGAACCAQGRASPVPTGRSGRRACQPLG